MRDRWEVGLIAHGAVHREIVVQATLQGEAPGSRNGDKVMRLLSGIDDPVEGAAESNFSFIALGAFHRAEIIQTTHIGRQ